VSFVQHGAATRSHVDCGVARRDAVGWRVVATWGDELSTRHDGDSRRTGHGPRAHEVSSDETEVRRGALPSTGRRQSRRGLSGARCRQVLRCLLAVSGPGPSSRRGSQRVEAACAGQSTRVARHGRDGTRDARSRCVRRVAQRRLGSTSDVAGTGLRRCAQVDAVTCTAEGHPVLSRASARVLPPGRA
jgi:hypothetical protein